MDTNLGIYAVITDIHGNAEALDAILSDFEAKMQNVREKRGATISSKIICLGDIVGYGPDQEECLERARKFDVIVSGNHEEITRLLLDHPDISRQGIKISEEALASNRHFVKQLIGATETLPEEKFEDMKKEDYAVVLAEKIAAEHIAQFKASPPELGIFSRQVTEEMLKQIGIDYLKQFLAKPELLETYHRRLERRDRVMRITDFIDKIRSTKIYTLNNAIFVHDNPIRSGDGRYLIGEKKEKEIKPEPRANLAKINKTAFPNIDYIFVGHSHARPGIEDVNDIKVVYCGGAIPRLDNPEKKTGYVIIGVENNKVREVVPIELSYDWKKTQAKMRGKGLYDFFGTK